MNISILMANILTLLAFLIHTFMGDRELKIIQPLTDPNIGTEKQEKWTMARCGWHWISFDLLFATIGLALINFTDYFDNEKTLLQILTIYFFRLCNILGFYDCNFKTIFSKLFETRTVDFTSSY